MGIRIFNNLAALTADRFLEINRANVEKSIESLSSGLRINRASDDAAGLTISEKLRAQVTGLRRASMNAQDGVSMLNTAEGALSVVHSMLQRVRELAVQAANDTLTQSDRVEIQKEIDQLKSEIDRTADTTEFNTKKLLDGSSTALVSTDSAATLEIIARDVVAEGNYRIEKQNSPSSAQVQKSDVFNLVATSKNPDGTRGLASDFTTTDSIFVGVGQQIRSEDLTSFENFEFSQNVGGTGNTRQDYRVVVGVADSVTADDQFAIIDHFFESTGGKSGFAITTVGNGPDSGDTGYYEMEVTDVLSNGGVIDTANFGASDFIELTVRKLDATGAVTDTQVFNVTHNVAAAASDLLGADGAGLVTTGRTTVDLGADSTAYEVGDKILFTVNAAEDFGAGGTNEFYHQIQQDVSDNGFAADTTGAGVVNDSAEDRMGLYESLGTAADAIDGSTQSVSLMYYDSGGVRQLGTGDLRYGESGWQVDANGGHVEFYLTETTLVDRTSQLNEIDKFQGLFDLGSQQLTIYDGAGNTATIVINGTDTMEGLAEKIRDAIVSPRASGGLGMSVDGDLSGEGVDGNVAVFVSESVADSEEAVAGTIVVRSTVPGQAGRLFFSAEQGLLDALSLAVIREPDDPMSIVVTNAHTGTFVGQATSDDGVFRNVIQGVDLIQDQRVDVSVRYVPAGELLTAGDITEGGAAAAGEVSVTTDIISGISTFSTGNFVDFQGLEPDSGAVGSTGNAIADYEVAITANGGGLDQFTVADYSFNAANTTKAGFAINANAAVVAAGEDGYYEIEVMGIDTGNDGTISAAERAAGVNATTANIDGYTGGMEVALRRYDINGTLQEEVTAVVGAAALAGNGATVANTANDYFSNNFDGQGSGLSTANDITGNNEMNLGTGTYYVGDKIVLAAADVSAAANVISLHNDTQDAGFDFINQANSAGPLNYQADIDNNVGAPTPGTAQVRVGLAQSVTPATAAGQRVNLTMGYYDSQNNFNVGGGGIVLGQAGDTIQAGAVLFTLAEDPASGPGFVFESAPGAVTEYVHIVDNRVNLHIGANRGQIMTTNIGRMDTTALGVDDLLVVSHELAEEAIAKADSAIGIVSSERAKLGAFVNRLEHTMNVLDIQAENLLAAESRIRDLDMAKATIDFTRNQILMQAGIALLAQANAMPQNVLQLLR